MSPETPDPPGGTAEHGSIETAMGARFSLEEARRKLVVERRPGQTDAEDDFVRELADRLARVGAPTPHVSGFVLQARLLLWDMANGGGVPPRLAGLPVELIALLAMQLPKLARRVLPVEAADAACALLEGG